MYQRFFCSSEKYKNQRNNVFGNNNSIFDKNLTHKNMKKLNFFAVLLFVSTSIFAQYVEVTPLTGYTFSGDVDAYYGTYDIEDALL